MRHSVDFGCQVLFKGNRLAYVWPDVVEILLLGAVLFAVSIRRFAPRALSRRCGKMGHSCRTVVIMSHSR